MQNMITPDDPNCPFEFNFDAATFQPGDIVSYRVSEGFDDMPFVGELIEVHDDFVVLHHFGEPENQWRPMRGTREDRPVVSREDALAE